MVRDDFADDKLVGDNSDVVVGNPLRDPNSRSLGVVGDYVEHPSLFRVDDSQCFAAYKESE